MILRLDRLECRLVPAGEPLPSAVPGLTAALAAAAASPPDLVIQSLTVDRAAATWGDAVGVRYQVRNDGPGPAVGGLATLELTAGRRTTPLGSVPIRNGVLPPGAVETGSMTVRLPGTPAAPPPGFPASGIVFLVMRVDPLNGSSNPGNVATASLSVSVGPNVNPPEPDPRQPDLPDDADDSSDADDSNDLPSLAVAVDPAPIPPIPTLGVGFLTGLAAVGSSAASDLVAGADNALTGPGSIPGAAWGADPTGRHELTYRGEDRAVADASGVRITLAPIGGGGTALAATVVTTQDRVAGTPGGPDIYNPFPAVFGGGGADQGPSTTVRPLQKVSAPWPSSPGRVFRQFLAGPQLPAAPSDPEPRDAPTGPESRLPPPGNGSLGHQVLRAAVGALFVLTLAGLHPRRRRNTSR